MFQEHNPQLFQQSRRLQRTLHEVNRLAARGRIAQPLLLHEVHRLHDRLGAHLSEWSGALSPPEAASAARAAARAWSELQAPWLALAQSLPPHVGAMLRRAAES